jgi:catechol 2,3-dioxygenase-like lactoylglutathione lyase family enzyme
MRPRISVITLGVNDLAAALIFYRDGLGLETEGITAADLLGDAEKPAGAVVMFTLEQGLILALYPRTELAKDARVPLGAPGATEFSIGHIVESRAEVDALLQRAVAAGATMTDAPRDRPWGIYSGYFKDPDGHLWEIIWNPQPPSA